MFNILRLFILERVWKRLSARCASQFGKFHFRMRRLHAGRQPNSGGAQRWGVQVYEDIFKHALNRSLLLPWTFKIAQNFRRYLQSQYRSHSLPHFLEIRWHTMFTTYAQWSIPSSWSWLHTSLLQCKRGKSNCCHGTENLRNKDQPCRAKQKVKIVELLDELSPSLRLIGAVNTVVSRTPYRLPAADGSGYMQAVRVRDMMWSEKPSPSYRASSALLPSVHKVPWQR